MFIVWSGWGILVLVIVVVAGAGTTLLGEQAFHLHPMYGAGIGALVSAGIIWSVGTKLNSSDKIRRLTDSKTGEEYLIKPNHSLFWIKMQYWAFIIGPIGMFIIGSGLFGHQTLTK